MDRRHAGGAGPFVVYGSGCARRNGAAEGAPRDAPLPCRRCGRHVVRVNLSITNVNPVTDGDRGGMPWIRIPNRRVTGTTADALEWFSHAAGLHLVIVLTNDPFFAANIPSCENIQKHTSQVAFARDCRFVMLGWLEPSLKMLLRHTVMEEFHIENKIGI